MLNTHYFQKISQRRQQEFQVRKVSSHQTILLAIQANSMVHHLKKWLRLGIFRKVFQMVGDHDI